MRLLFVIDCLGSGGAQRQMTSLAVELKRRGHDIDVFVYHDIDHFGNEIRAAGVRVLLHPKPAQYSVAPVRALRRLYRNGGYDLVLSFLTVPNVYSVLAGIGMWRRPKVVVSERYLPRTGITGVKNALCERLYPWADRITANSHHMREYYCRRYGWGDDRVVTIWNGLDVDRFAATPLVRHPGEPLRLLCIGRLDPTKCWEMVALAAAKLIAKHGVRVTISLVGNMNRLLPSGERYVEELKSLRHRLGLDEAWTFLGERKDIEQLIAGHHALVHPSLAEGLPNVVCESLACGRPVIATDAFDHRRLIQHGETGWLFPPGDVEGLVDALRRLDELPPDELAAMGQSARRFAEQHLTVARLADEYEALFERLVGGERAVDTGVRGAGCGARDVAVADSRRDA